MAGKRTSAEADQDPQLATLDDLRSGNTDGKRTVSASQDCRQDVCDLGDHGEKWAGQTNFTCTRCPFATISEETARARNPKAFAKAA